MKKILLIVLSVFAFFSLVSVAQAVSFSDLTNLQKQFYWSCMKNDCTSLLLVKNYQAYGQCALSCLSKAVNYKESGATCTDSDGGANYLQKGIVKTNLKPEGINDYVYTFPNGSTYLMEGMCSGDNKYYYIQKNCSELGKKYHADVAAGACVYVNNVPVFEPIGDKNVNEGETFSFSVSATDKDWDQLVYSAENLPNGAVFNGGIFIWTPSYKQAGTYAITFKVSDGEGEDKSTIKIVV